MNDIRTIYLENPTDEQKSSLEDFFRKIEAPVNLLDSEADANIVIDWPGGRETCTPERLRGGGRISCPDAFKAAARLRIDRGHMGDLLNQIDIRIFGCQLGCFK